MTDSIEPRRLASRSLIEAIVEDADLVAAVRQLEPHVLGDLVRHVGLEDSGDLLSLATVDQLRGLADDDLWRAERAGGDETFDADRFALWVEVLVEMGADTVASALSSLDEDLLSHALAQHMIVLDLDALVPMMSAAGPLEQLHDTELANKILETSLSHEIESFLLLSIRGHGWDALIEAIHELDRRDHELIRRLLERSCNASMNRVAEDGLYTVLSEAESLAEDALAGRDDRREQRGYVAVADARAFLAAARLRPAAAGEDPVTKSYFRTYRPRSPAPASSSRLSALLRKRGVKLGPRALPAAAHRDSPARLALSRLRELDGALHQQRMLELLYLANVMSAGRTLDQEPMNQIDALTSVLTFIDAGLELADSGAIEHQSLVKLFALGWSHAHAPSPEGGDAIAAARSLLERM